MLQQEQERGAYGLPQPLPDRAYMHFENIKHQLDLKLDDVYDDLIDTYDTWISGHEGQLRDWASESASESAWQWLHEMSFDELAEQIGEGEFLELLKEFTEEHEILNPEDEWEPLDQWQQMEQQYKERSKDAPVLTNYEQQKKQRTDFQLDEWQDYIESLPKQSKFLGMIKAQQEELFEGYEPTVQKPPYKDWKLEDFRDIYEANEGEIKEEIGSSSRMDAWIEAETEMHEEALSEDMPHSGVQEMRDRLEYEYEDADLSDKIILFQEALTTAHNSGEMSEHLLGTSDAQSILNELSAGPKVDEWNRDLARLLGYEVGSRMLPQEQQWYMPAFKHLARVIIALNLFLKKE
jgi:hypothetical protein